MKSAIYLPLTCLCSGLCTSLFINGNYVWCILAAILLCVAIYRIVQSHLESLRKISFMFNAIDCDDYSFKFSENTANTNNRMFNTSLNRIKEIMQNAKIRAQEREKYYELIMNSVNTGIITVDEKGCVYQVNQEAMELFGLTVFTHLKQLGKIDKQLCPALHALKSGERIQLTIGTERGDISIAASASAVQYDGNLLKVIAINDIKNELDEKQVESWIKLTRILTHEIMNSLAPITSLSDTLIHLNPDKSGELAQGLETINSTGKSLIAFVNSYRKFTRLQAPKYGVFPLKPLIEKVAALLCHGVPTQINVLPHDIMLYADEDMATQVLVNLLKNAVQATNDYPSKQIEIKASINDNENIIIAISNSGHAIPQEMAEDIFVPFFTTKPEGSGIGLSISRQIMHLHGGSIKLTSNTEGNITFTLRFP